MKKILFVFCFLGLLISCSDNDKKNGNPSNGLIGEWILSEINIDPGDGSGVFEKVESDKTLIFKENNEIISNGSLCDAIVDSDSPSIGTYEFDENSDTSGKIITDCQYSLEIFPNPTFTLKDSKLYVSYHSCDEYCGAIFIRK